MSRIQAIVLTIAGLVVLTALLVQRRNLAAALRQGPRWRRRLLAAGLVALVGLGCFSVIRAVTLLIGPRHTTAPEGLEANPDWQQIASAWAEATDITNGKHGAYPFLLNATRERFLRRLQAATQACENLARSNLLTAAEAGLLAAGLKELTARVESVRAKSEMLTSCYILTMLPPASQSAARLQDRLALLEQLAAQSTVQPAVLSRVLTGLETDLAVLSSEPELARLVETNKTQAIQTREAAAAALRAIRVTLGEGQTPATRWQAIEEAWQLGQQVAPPAKSTSAELTQLNYKFRAAGQAINALRSAGQITEPEAQLLQQDLEQLREHAQATARSIAMVSCYDMAFLEPAQSSLKHLVDRLPILQQLQTNATVQPAVLAKILATLRADLQVLGDEKQLESLTEPQRTEARKLRAEAAKLLEQLRQP